MITVRDASKNRITKEQSICKLSIIQLLVQLCVPKGFKYLVIKVKDFYLITNNLVIKWMKFNNEIKKKNKIYV